MKCLLILCLLFTLSTNAQNVTLENIQKTHQLTDFDKINEGIVIFDKNGCSRCEKVILFCAENKLNFKLLNISESEQNAAIMWHFLELMEYPEETVQTPVVIVNGTLTYNHKNLDAFLQKLITP